MGSKTPPIIRSEVVAQVKNKIAQITDPSKLSELYRLTPCGSEIRQIIEDRWEEIAKQIALTKTAQCRTEEEARKLYKNNPRPHKRESNAIYFACWKLFADKEASVKASACQTYEDALTLYKNAPDPSEARNIYFELLQKFEENLIHGWLHQCTTSEEIDTLLEKLITHEQKEKCREKKDFLQNAEIRELLLRCTSVDEVRELLEKTRGSSKTQDLALFLFEKFAIEKIPEESAKCQTSEDAKRLERKYAHLMNISKIYKELYLALLAKEARTFVESLTRNSEDVMRNLYKKYDSSPKDSEARRIYFEKYCELHDEEDKELLPFGNDVSLDDFSHWYTEVSSGEHSDYPNARRMETIFMNQLLEQGLI